jgi:ABC-type glycerol-3-phosphate transport system substrate-binding protein
VKYVFLAVLFLLTAASVATWWSMPDAGTGTPVMYWVTDANPARGQQIELFHRWQLKNGHFDATTAADASAAKAMVAHFNAPAIRRASPIIQSGETPETATLTLDKLAADGFDFASLRYPVTLRTPKLEMRVDTGNNDNTKKIVQSVSGVGGDVMDLYGGGQVRQLAEMGVVRDVTADAARLGFGLDKTYPAAAAEILIPQADGSTPQFAFPCNIFSAAFIVNKDAFDRAGVATPPRQWTCDTFERIGREWVAKANASGGPRAFFADTIDHNILRRSYGVSDLNESLTAAALDDPRAVAAMQRYYDWTYRDRLLPSGADRASFTSDSGYGGGNPQLFAAGRFALLNTGRHLLITFRQFNIDRVKRGERPMRLAVAELPYAEFPNTMIQSRSAVVYAGSPRPDLAVLFQAFLASDDYNMQVVRDADSLPPGPAYAKRPEYLTPPPDPAAGIDPESENEVHGPFAEVALERAVGWSFSPFVQHSVVTKEVDLVVDELMNNRKTAEQAMRDAARRIDAEIARNLQEKPAMRPAYDAAVRRQQQIDAMKAALVAFELKSPGTPVPHELRIPLNLIDNYFHRAYYRHKGWVK